MKIRRRNFCLYFFPREWECTRNAVMQHPAPVLFPTRVGVYLPYHFQEAWWPSFSHTRGSIPLKLSYSNLVVYFFPHTWEYTFKNGNFKESDLLFPTHVGVYPAAQVDQMRERAFSHTRGSIPTELSSVSNAKSFFPHTWEYTCMATDAAARKKLFPTRVGAIQ